MKQTELQLELNKFRDYVISQAKANLTRQGKNVSKGLYNSIKGNVKANPNSFEMDFSMEEYGFYQDKGVSGIKKKYNTDYKYTNKMPPAKAFDKWVVRKGLAPREKGKFKNRKSLSFAIARSVYINGIKPSLFFTKPFEKAFKRLPSDLVEAFGLDAIKLFNTTTFPNQK
jgi:hypothetical protein